MTTRAEIDDFLGYKNLALVRVSPTIQVTGGKLDEELKPKGYTVIGGLSRRPGRHSEAR